jgi:hypothetical protein
MKSKPPAIIFLLSAFTMVFALLFPHSGIIPISFGYAIPVLVLIWMTLKYTGESFKSIGFNFKKFESQAVLSGVVFAILLFGFLAYVFIPILQNILKLPKTKLDDFAFLKGNIPGLTFMIVMGWLVGGIYEEIVFHGYIFSWLEKILPGERATLASFLVTNIIFGLYHFQSGITGILTAFVAGCAYQLLMLANNRNGWYAIFFHGFYDTIALTAIYFGKS